MIGLWFVLKWIAISASAWLQVLPNIKHLRIIYTIGLIISGGLLAAWLGTYFLINDLGQDIPISFLILPLGVPALAIANPLTTIGLFGLWAFPLSSGLWRGRADSNRVEWAFLDSTSERVAFLDQSALRPGLAAIIGLIGGLVFWAWVLVVRGLLTIGLPEMTRSTDSYKLALFFLGILGPAVTIQAVVALSVAASVTRLGGTHGLFATSLAGCIMSLGILGVNLLWRDVVDVASVWNNSALVVNGGGLLVLPIAWLTSAVARLFRGSKSESIPRAT